MLSIIPSTMSYQAPLVARSVSTVQMSAITPGDIGTTKPLGVYDPLQLMTKNPEKYRRFQEMEIKHGRMCMLAWTGVWATHVGGMGLGMHLTGMPVESDWTKALGVFSAEHPAMFAAILLFISIAEGESVGHSGDNWRNMSTKEPGNLGFDFLGLTKKLSEEDAARYKIVELKNGRAAMIAMASLFAAESIPGSVPVMNIFN